MVQTTTFIHAADLHLGASFKGLLATSGDGVAGRFIEAVPQAFDRIIELCISKKVDFLILSGDVFNEGEVSYRIQKRFIDGMSRLDQSGIPVYICTGNHDPYPSWRKRIPILPQNVHLFPVNEPGCFVFERAGQKDGQVDGQKDGQEDGQEGGQKGGEGGPEGAVSVAKPLVLLVGQSYQTAEESRDLVSRFPHRAARCTDAASTVTDGPATAGTSTATDAPTTSADPVFSVGVVHTGIDDPRYAPCTKDELISCGYDYWALGHVHAKGQVGKLQAWYPGTPQGLDINEDTEHGCYLVELSKDTDEAGVGVQTTFFPTGSIAWEQPSLDISGIEDQEALTAAIVSAGNALLSKNGIPVSMRLSLTGRTPMHLFLKKAPDVREMCGYVEDRCTTGDLWLHIDDVVDLTASMVDLSLIREENLFPATLLSEVDGLGEDRRTLQIVVREALSKRAVGSLSDTIDLDAALLRARDICMDMLVGGDE